MGLNLRLSGHDPEPHETDIGSAGGVNNAFKWMTSLPKGEYPSVEAFARDGRYTDTDELERQMNQAAIDHPPPEDGTDTIVRLLLNRIGAGHPDETVAIVG